MRRAKRGIRIVLLLDRVSSGAGEGRARSPDSGGSATRASSAWPGSQAVASARLAPRQPLVTRRERPPHSRARRLGGVAGARSARALRRLTRTSSAPARRRAAAEIAETLAATGLSAGRADRSLAGALTHHMTIVHGTHCDDARIDAPGRERGANGLRMPDDGGQPRRRNTRPPGGCSPRARPIRVCSDSNTILDPLAELRELEHIARRTCRAPQRAGPLAGDDGAAPRPPVRAGEMARPRWARGAP